MKRSGMENTSPTACSAAVKMCGKCKDTPATVYVTGKYWTEYKARPTPWRGYLCEGCHACLVMGALEETSVRVLRQRAAQETNRQETKRERIA